MTNPNDPAAPTNKSYTMNDPAAGDYTTRESPMYPGLTKREFFAAMAMQGFIARARDSETWRGVAESAIGLADALIAELSK